ncbi:hypothetical protein Tco_0021784, partial [Tanacetum coccineum]
ALTLQQHKSSNSSTNLPTAALTIH